jgi:hypothetical protein
MPVRSQAFEKMLNMRLTVFRSTTRPTACLREDVYASNVERILERQHHRNTNHDFDFYSSVA